MVLAILQGNLTRWSGLPGQVSFSLRIIRNDSNKLMFKGNHNNSSSSSFRYARKAYELAPLKLIMVTDLSVGKRFTSLIM